MKPPYWIVRVLSASYERAGGGVGFREDARRFATRAEAAGALARWRAQSKDLRGAFSRACIVRVVPKKRDYAAREIVSDLSAVLASVQWVYGWCPSCSAAQPKGHEPYCQLVAVLRKAGAT